MFTSYLIGACVCICVYVQEWCVLAHWRFVLQSDLQELSIIIIAIVIINSTLCWFSQSYYPNLSQILLRTSLTRGDKECPFSGVPIMAQFGRRVPESEVWSVQTPQYNLNITKFELKNACHYSTGEDCRAWIVILGVSSWILAPCLNHSLPVLGFYRSAWTTVGKFLDFNVLHQPKLASSWILTFCVNHSWPVLGF